jgi:hypothetical protein
MNWFARWLLKIAMPKTAKCSVCDGKGVDEWPTAERPEWAKNSAGYYRVARVCWNCKGAGRIAILPALTAPEYQ